MASEPALAMIVAVAENGVIGRDGAMPWRLSSDLKRFRALTMGKPMIMGRKTYQSIGRPLEGRESIVVTRQSDFNEPGTHRASSLEAAIELATGLVQAAGLDEIIVIGGAQIYAAALARATRIYLTRVHARPEGDTFFPELNKAQWREISCERYAPGERDDFASSFVVLERTAN